MEIEDLLKIKLDEYEDLWKKWHGYYATPEELKRKKELEREIDELETSLERDVQKDLEWFFFTKGLRTFISEEMNKHSRILFSYEKRKELDISEKMMLDVI